MGITVVVFAGEYDLACKEQLRDELARLYAEPNVVLDFSEVTYLDSTCVTELLRMRRARQGSGFDGDHIVVGNRTVRKIFDMLGIDKVFRVVDTLDDALPKNGEAATVRYAFRGGFEPVPNSLQGIESGFA